MASGMSEQPVSSDGVNREGLDFRAGWVEALRAFGTKLGVAGLRAKKGEHAGMDAASNIAKQMHDDMLAKMRGQ
jgi:hypothetical protein